MAATPEYSVKVNNVPPSTNSSDLRNAFEAFGYTDITDVYLPEKFLKQGFGFVRFSAQEQAQRAAEDTQLVVNQTQLKCEAALTEKRKIGAAVEQAVQPSPSGEYSVWCGNLPPRVSSETLRDAAGSRGVDGMTDVYIPPDKGFGFLRFGSYDEACSALKACQGLDIDGRPLELKLSAGKQKGGSAAPDPFAWGYSGSGYGGGCFSQLVAPGWGADAWGYGSGGYAGMGKGASSTRLAEAFNYGLSKGVESSMSAQSSGKAAEHSVWVGGLAAGVTKEEISEAFNSRGVHTMTDVYVPPGKDFGFVRFATWEETSFAQQSCTELRIRGKLVEMKLSSQEKLKRGGGGAALPPSPFGMAGCKGHPPIETMAMGKGGYGHAAAALVAPSGYGCAAAAMTAPSGKGGGFGWNMVAPSFGGSGQKASNSEISIKVGNLGPGTTTDDLWRAFSAWGIAEMSDIYIPNGKSFGFLRFQKMSVAQAAMQCVGMNVRGSNITCEFAEGGKKTSNDMAWSSSHGLPAGLAPAPQLAPPQLAQSGNAEVSVKVGNLPFGTTTQDIMSAFAEQGIDAMTDCYIPMGRPFGFVRFGSEAAGRVALQRTVYVRGTRLELEPSVNSKRSSGDMASSFAPPAKMSRQLTMPFAMPAQPAAGHSDAGAGAPSVKVSMVPTGCTSDELRRALLDAGCTGNMTDVYVPKGDRGFGFVRFNTEQEAYNAATQLRASIRGSPLGLEVAVQERRNRM